MISGQRPFRPVVGAQVPAQGEQAEMEYSAFPLSLYLWDPTRVVQTGFGMHAAAILSSKHGQIVPKAISSGLRIYARDEVALLAPIEELLACFGEHRLRLSGPHVRFWPGTPMRWPVMDVLVRVPRCYAAAVRIDLADRGARSVRVDNGLIASIVRAQVPQTRLMGYAGWLEALTDGLGEVAVRLSHYAPPSAAGFDPDPEPRAA